MLDSDLAELYQVLTKNLNLGVRRNSDRFPVDFSFQLTKEEAEGLRLQLATSKTGRGGRRYLPYAVTEHGVSMLLSVLNSKRAVQMNILIIRAFVKLREILATHKDLARAIEDLSRKQDDQGTEKIMSFSTAPRLTRLTLLSSWGLFMSAISACGIGLAYISVGAGRVVYGERTDYEHVSTVTLVWIGAAGAAFILGLVLMLITVARSVLQST